MTVVQPQVVIQPRIPLAADVIKRMVRLLEARHHLRVTRPAFMRQWKALRRQMNMTVEYKDLKARIALRASYACEDCGDQRHCDMHHIEAVAWNPTKVLDENNVRYICRRCHILAHRPSSRPQAASRTIPTSRRSSAPRTKAEARSAPPRSTSSRSN